VNCNAENRIKARRGEQCATKLTQVQALEIFNRRAIGRELTSEAHKLSNPALAEKYGISHKSVGRIINGHRWLTKGKGKYGVMEYADAGTLRSAAKERDRLKSLAAEHSLKALAAQFGVSENLVSLIGTGDRWVYLSVSKSKGKGL